MWEFAKQEPFFFSFLVVVIIWNIKCIVINFLNRNKIEYSCDCHYDDVEKEEVISAGGEE